MVGSFETTSNVTAITPPFWVLAELTYCCPLHCVFCSNPVNLDAINTELDTQTWKHVLAQARELGAVQLGFSGGEPLQRDDLEELIAYAHELGFYTNLITSGVGLTEPRAKALKAAGLDHVQLSFQDSTAELNDFLSHTRTFELKQQVAKLIKEQGWPMVMNVVLHRHNLDHVDKIIDMALDLDAQYLELANTQYYGWAWKNRLALLPTKKQLLRAEAVVNDYRKQIGDRCRIIFVVPDYFEDRPKACMNGWGNVFLAIAPDGLAMPCHAARELPGLDLPNVQTNSIRDIWYESHAFNAYRGEHWMAEPCRSCDERHKDFGGCRCQAWLLTGQANQADPVCSKSPHHERVVELINRPGLSGNEASGKEQPLVFRQNAGLPDRG
ncbi:MAG: pyrroloquinoline quinone biosynthesis protein PqqE [Burkholderiaceae bacterium]|nr:pyrroloquinoline quinone biosynthesis protein PqqE [Burkholderiaceae bacterium]MCD8516913.1 pyrroloquinoline quinone biosynthesis protein PqqE [Burkholderiaceae bacterium]MCD8537568.1 pyrroloquinoline quinone biosynthesis protein PqqE [Burkholderiaceae bacterium]